MKALGAGVGIMVVAFALFFFMPFDQASATTLQVKTISQTAAGVITTSGTSATITLTAEAWKDRIGSISAIAGGAGDTPVAASLSADGKTLVVSGLATSATRALVIPYGTDNLTDFPMLSTSIGMSLAIIFLAGLGLAIYGGWASIKGRN